jgi:amino acid transporter
VKVRRDDSNGGVAPHDASTRASAAGRLGSLSITVLALAAAAPVPVVTMLVPDAYVHGPVAPSLLAVGLLLVLFSAGYAAMARRGPHPGPLYAFLARGLGRPVGVGAAGLAVTSYLALQLALYGAAGAAAAPLLDAWTGVTAPWWAVAAACWAAVAALGPVRIGVVAAVLGPPVLTGLAVLGGVAVASLRHPADDLITWDTLVPTTFPADRAALGLLLVLAAVAFLGFETAAAYGEEAVQPRRSAGRAGFAVVAVLAVLYPVTAWAMSLAAGPDRMAALAAARGPEAWFDLAGARLAPWAVTLGRVLLLAGLLAALVAVHHTTTRYLVALGRERLLPAPLGRMARRTGAPRAASLTQSLVVAAALGAAARLDPDSPAVTARWPAAAGAVGLLLLLAGASLAALLLLNRAPEGENVLVRLVAPALATVGLGALASLAVTHLPALLGVPPGARPAWLIPVGCVAVLVTGAAYALVLWMVRPVRYAGIGLGGTAVVVSRAVPKPRQPGAHRPERVNGGAGPPG